MLGVVVIINRRKSQVKFEDENEGRIFYGMAREKFGDENTHLISLTTPIPPFVGYVPHKPTLWCPCCGTERRFKEDKKFEVLRCPVCGISDSYFYTRSYNQLGAKTEKVKRIRRPKGSGKSPEAVTSHSSGRGDGQHRKNNASRKPSKKGPSKNNPLSGPTVKRGHGKLGGRLLSVRSKRSPK